MRLSFVIISFFALSCSGGKTANPANTVAVTFGIKWVIPGQQKPIDVVGGALYAVDCAAVGVSFISVNVTNSSGASVASGGPWACTAGFGTIAAVPVGNNYTFTVNGMNSGGTTLYQGQQSGVNLVAGNTNDIGTIAVNYVGAGTGTGTGTGTATGTHAGMVFVAQGSGGFYMDTTEVTQEAYQRVVGSNPSYFTGCPTCPVEQVTWYEADTYCRSVGKRLPKEAEWEYAATSGGTGQTYAGTSDVTLLPQYAWYVDNSGNTTHPVGQKLPNGLGLYDMTGNVYEWTDSWWDTTNTYRVFRGGSWLDVAGNLRAAYRDYAGPVFSYGSIGFRCSQYPPP